MRNLLDRRQRFQRKSRRGKSRTAESFGWTFITGKKIEITTEAGEQASAQVGYKVAKTLKKTEKNQKIVTGAGRLLLEVTEPETARLQNFSEIHIKPAVP